MSFAALMALSASQTKESQTAVQSALQQRQRNEELIRKKREESERKELEAAAKLRLKRFEDEKKQRELEVKKEAERRRMEEEQARREEEQRNALLYGPKKARSGPKWPSSSGTSKEDIRRRRAPSDDDASRSGSPAAALTREEKRQRRTEAEMRRSYALKRAAASSGYHKAGKRLPGGAIDATSAPNSDSANGTQSVKARLAAIPNTLTKLNVNKRDTRTIDEILQDRAKAKIATGDEAKEFSDWFGKGKKDTAKASTRASTAAPSRASSGSNSPGPSASSEYFNGHILVIVTSSMRLCRISPLWRTQELRWSEICHSVVFENAAVERDRQLNIIQD
jgi:protein SPT2